MGRESDGVISLTYGDLGRTDQNQLQRNRVFERDSVMVTKKNTNRKS